MSIKKVLLMGEFSSVHLNLRDGLRELGINVRVASFGDGFKNYERDINLASKQKYPKIIRYPLLGGYLTLKSPHFINNDIVQLIYPIIFTNLRFNNFVARRILKGSNRKLFYNVCGHDSTAFDLYHAGAFKNMSCDAYKGILEDEARRDQRTMFATKDEIVKSEKKVLKYVDGVIANIYDYYLPYSIAMPEKLKGVIPFPINVSKYTYAENKPGTRLKIFYGVSKGREGYKGTDIILAALEQIRERFSTEVDIEIVTSIPFQEYQEKLRSCNIFIDQVNSFDTGMAALQAMAMGRVVLSGAKKEIYQIKETDTLPYFDAPPSVDKLVEVITSLILRKKEFPEIGWNARKYIETYHDCVKVAGRYLEKWEL